jgi:serine/threonine kinase 38
MFQRPPPLLTDVDDTAIVDRSCHLDDFENLGVLGRGAFGEVILVRKRKERQPYAMKVLKKREMVLRDQVENIWSERQLLIADNPWFVQLHYSFQDDKYLFLVMDFAAGGDLMELLIRKHALPESQARFYAAELAIAINHIHSMNFAHRDLKPDNILIDSTGHLKLTDFGLCKEFCERTTTESSPAQDFLDKLENMDFNVAAQIEEGVIDEFDVLDAEDADDLIQDYRRSRTMFKSMVGTANYMAPEIFRKQSYDKSVDWWAYGAILFEMVCGYAPFYSKRGDNEVAKNVMRYKRTFYIPRRAKVSQDLKALMRGLITDSSKRLTFQDIKAHPWLDQVRWDRLRSLKAPWTPTLNNNTDIVNFGNFGSPAIFKNPGPTPVESMQKHFRDFTWNRKPLESKQAHDTILEKLED